MSSVFETCLKKLDVIIFKARDLDKFECVGEPAQWFQDFLGQPCQELDRKTLLDRLPFLDFLLRSRADLTSQWEGPFEVESLTGRRYQIRFSFLSEDEEIFAIDNLAAHEQNPSQELLQKARENVLRFDRYQKAVTEREFLLRCIFHDLAGPLTCLTGILPLLEDPKLTKGQEKHFLALANRQCQRQRKMIEELLELYSEQIENSQTIRHDLPEIDVASVAGEVVEALQPAYALRSVKLILQGASVQSRVKAEKGKLERVLTNLLENALRSVHPEGQVEVRVSLDQGNVLLEVQDNGPGIAVHLQPNLFRSEMKKNRPYAGKLGLGLYFCRLAVEGWGGTVTYQDAPEGGAHFFIRIPQVQKQSQGA